MSREKQWRHALERMRERHSPDATMEELKALVPACREIVRAWNKREKVLHLGSVVGYQGGDSVDIRIRWRDGWVRLVYVVHQRIIRTVLPNI